jgi:hypothetical protein
VKIQLDPLVLPLDEVEVPASSQDGFTSSQIALVPFGCGTGFVLNESVCSEDIFLQEIKARFFPSTI